MARNVPMPDGTVVKNVPDGVSDADVMKLYQYKAPMLSNAEIGKGVMKSFSQGQTLGLSDELASGMAALPAYATRKMNEQSLGPAPSLPEVYGDIRGKMNQEQQQFEQQYPKTALAAETAGGIATLAPGATRIAKTPWAQAHPMQAAAATGAGAGAVSGAGYAPKLEDIPSYMAATTPLGAVAGPGGVLMGNLLSRFVGQPIKRMFTTETPKTSAARMTGHFLNQDQLQPLEIIKKLQAHPEMTLADVGGRSTKGLAQVVSTIGGPWKNQAGKFFVDRQSKSYSRVMDSLKKMTGGDENYFSNMKKIVDRKMEEAGPLYEKAAAKSVAIDEDLMTLLDRPSVKSAFKKGQTKAANEGVSLPNIELGGQIDFRSFDYMKRALDDKIGVALRAGKKDDARILINLKNDLLDIADIQIPEYAAARKVYSIGASNENAMEMGKRVLKDDFEEMAFQVERMSDSEKDAFVNGALKTIRDRLMTGREDKNAATKLASQLFRERMKNIFPDEESFKTFINQLDIEDSFARTYQNVYGGSPTQPRQMATQEVGDVYRGGPGFTGQDTHGIILNEVRAITGQVDIPDPVVNEIGRLLYTPSKNLTQKDLALLEKWGIKMQDFEQLRGNVSTALATATQQQGTSQFSNRQEQWRQQQGNQ